MVQRIDISQGWEFKQSSPLNDGTASSYLPVAQFPTVAHIDLLHHKLIPDPYIDINELECLWVNNADWTYRTEKIEPVTFKESERAVLVFEGLDTVVDVYLNDKHILFSNNMHITNRVDVTDHLRGREEPSVLELKFRAAPAYARSEMDRIGYKRLPTGRAVNFGGPERLFVRKAQYHWGWDWGPAINTSGPWKPIYLEVYESRISQFLVSQNVADDLSSVDITVKGKVQNPNEIGKVTIQLVDNSNEDEVVAAFVEFASNGSFECHLKVDDPKLWYPFMYGEQHLYTIKGSIPGHTVHKTVGMRRLRLLEEPLKDQPGTSFMFEVNNIRLFCGGSCWIPADFMLPRIDQRTRENWFRLMKEGNQTMVRVWGGGIVEDDMFYDIADRQGILVWQDFLFACGNYPASPDFVANVKNEAEQQVERVGHHASLVLWCGNNEDYMCADQDRCWDVDYSDTTGPWDKTTFPAREIYERTLPGVIVASGTDVPYWISSPYGGEESNDTTVGDTHCWDVWHGKLSPYQDYKIYKSRFISEFGFESAPSLKTLERAITDPKERHSQSRTFDAHDKGPGHARRYPMYMGENYRFRMNPLKDFVYCSQFLQAEALGYAYNLWRREFRGPGQEYCAGALVWQMNDIWPGSSWALVDVSNRPKPAYYVTRRALAKTVLGMERVVTEKPPYITTGYPDEKSKLDVWAVNGELEDRRVILELKAFDIQSGKQIELAGDYQKEWVLKASQTTELLADIDIPNHRETVIAGYLTDPTGKDFLEKRLARWISWPEPLKYMRPCPNLKVTTRNWGHNSRVILSTNAPVKGVVVNGKYRGAAANNYTGGYDATFYDNFIDLVPGEEVYVKVRGVLWGEEAVTVRFLYDWELEPGFEL